jgi:hypothetical protein
MLTVGRPITYGNLTVFPVYSKERPKVSSDYLTLQEALKRDLIAVKEMPSAEVSRVSITNRAVKPIYLMAGDIILGGKQDREVARDTIVPKGAKEFVVEVFCVEHGRWTGESHFRGGEIASGSLRLETQRSKEQQKVWSQVAREARALKAETASGTYRAVAGRTASQQEIQALVKTLGAPLTRDPRAVGMLVAINGEVNAGDVFADHRLFAQQLPKLLKSYALDAAQQKEAWAKLPRKPKAAVAEAERLLRDADRGDLRTLPASGATSHRERENDSTVVFEAAPAQGLSSGGAGGFGGAPAHRNIYRKR